MSVEKVGHGNSVNWNHTDLSLNWNQNYYDSINIDPKHTTSNQPILANLKNIGSIHDSSDICAIEGILSLPVHLVHKSPPVPDLPIFTNGKSSDPPSPSHDLSEESDKYWKNHYAISAVIA